MKKLDSNKQLLRDFLYGNTLTKTLASLEIENKLDAIDFLEKEMEGLRSEVMGTKKGDGKVKTAVKNGLGYLIFYGQTILIGEKSSGKFRLLEVLGNEIFKRAKTLDIVIQAVRNKNKNDKDERLSKDYLKKNRQLELLITQVKEINRAITKHILKNKLDYFPYRITLKEESGAVLLSKRHVGARGE